MADFSGVESEGRTVVRGTPGRGLVRRTACGV